MKLTDRMHLYCFLNSSHRQCLRIRVFFAFLNKLFYHSPSVVLLMPLPPTPDFLRDVIPHHIIAILCQSAHKAEVLGQHIYLILLLFFDRIWALAWHSLVSLSKPRNSPSNRFQPLPSKYNPTPLQAPTRPLLGDSQAPCKLIPMRFIWSFANRNSKSESRPPYNSNSFGSTS